MTSRFAAHTSAGVSRRTVAKTAAWSVPAVTVAAAAPTLAASTAATVDLMLQGQPFGDGVAGYSEDRSRMYELTLIGGFDATNMGTAAAPAGSTVNLSFDSRLFSGVTLTADDVAVTAGTPRTSGNLTTIPFRLDNPIPVGGLVSLRPSLVRVGGPEAAWATDIEPYTVTITPATGTTDSVPDNNSVSTTARYYDTNDAALTATWREHNLVTAAGDPLPINVQDTLTVTANTPGDIPTDSSLIIGGPTVHDGTGYVDVFEDVRIVSATLDGQDVADTFVKQPSSGGDDRVEWRIGVAIPAGQQLVVDVDVDIATSTREFVYSGAWTQFMSQRDRDDSNNRADTGPFPA
ncbi:hypothetical protein [Janibacter sp. Soil728]|uniref:hypothetical protein n=1 Tax=Janibacter sp. Soil728 TaxID=1736393 RepID=UPI000A80EFFC|nr:hypothetical protein [Janibacter sp. Soil728]